MSKISAQRPFRILLVEDNPADVAIIRLAMNRCKGMTFFDLQHAQDGAEALRCLRGLDPDAAIALPDLILLDINLPGMGGIECLSEIRADPALTHLPVLVLSSSDAKKDIFRAYQLHANGYVHKPVGIEELLKAFETLIDFWFVVVKRPTGGG